mmetsp:Transcript_7408/g.27680  ORF Transcript_7408/g.27680 Transcript_7408/m.27680 type:complete len:1005 (-) Transcript_7408:26-3040(-)
MSYLQSTTSSRTKVLRRRKAESHDDGDSFSGGNLSGRASRRDREKQGNILSHQRRLSSKSHKTASSHRAADNPVSGTSSHTTVPSAATTATLHKYIRWVNSLHVPIPHQYEPTMQHFIPEAIPENDHDSERVFFFEIESHAPNVASPTIGLFTRVLADGILLCAIVSHLTNQRIMHLNWRPMSLRQASSNIDKALQLLWKKGVVATRMPEAHQVYEQNLERVSSLFHEMFEVFVMRPKVRRRMSHMQKWFASINDQYGRKLFTNANFWEDFRDAVAFIVVFHALTPPEDRQGRFQIFWHPEDEDELALNIEYCLSLMESFDIPVMWNVSEYMLSSNDLDFLSFQMYVMWENLRDAEIFPISPQDEMFEEVARLQKQRAESEGQKIVPQENRKLKKIAELSSRQEVSREPQSARGAERIPMSARGNSSVATKSPVPVTLYDIQSKQSRNTSRDYADADDEDSRPSRRPPGPSAHPQSHPQKLLSSYKRRNERINTSKKMTPGEQRRAYDEKQRKKRLALRPKSRAKSRNQRSFYASEDHSAQDGTQTAYTELLSRQFSSGKGRSPNKSLEEEESGRSRRKVAPEPTPAPSSPRQPTFSLGQYTSSSNVNSVSPRNQSPRRAQSPVGSPRNGRTNMQSKSSYGVILSQDATETKPRTFQIESTREVPPPRTSRSVGRQPVHTAPSPRSAASASISANPPHVRSTKVMSGRDMDSMMGHLREVKKQERNAVRTKKSIVEKAEPTRSVMSPLSSKPSLSVRAKQQRSESPKAHKPLRRFGSSANFETDTPTSVRSIHALELDFDNANRSARSNEVVFRVGERTFNNKSSSRQYRTEEHTLRRTDSQSRGVDSLDADNVQITTDEAITASSLSPRGNETYSSRSGHIPRHGFSSSQDDLTDFNPLSKYEIPSLNLSQLAMNNDDMDISAQVDSNLEDTFLKSQANKTNSSAFISSDLNDFLNAVEDMTQDELDYEKTLDVLRRQLLNSNGMMAPPSGEIPRRRAPQPGW